MVGFFIYDGYMVARRFMLWPAFTDFQMFARFTVVFPLIRSAPFSPIMILGAFVLPAITVGMIEASTTLNPSIPLTLKQTKKLLSTNYQWLKCKRYWNREDIFEALPRQKINSVMKETGKCCDITTLFTKIRIPEKLLPIDAIVMKERFKSLEHLPPKNLLANLKYPDL